MLVECEELAPVSPRFASPFPCNLVFHCLLQSRFSSSFVGDHWKAGVYAYEITTKQRGGQRSAGPLDQVALRAVSTENPWSLQRGNEDCASACLIFPCPLLLCMIGRLTQVLGFIRLTTNQLFFRMPDSLLFDFFRREQPPKRLVSTPSDCGRLISRDSW